MKMTLNKSYGVFDLPEDFEVDTDDYSYNWHEDERLAEFVESKGGKVRTNFGLLKVVEIPDDCTDWELNDYDGYESIIYVVDGKIYHT